MFAKLITMAEIWSPFLVFLIASINVLQDDEFMQRKEKALKTVTDICVSMLDVYDQEASGFSNEMVVDSSV